MKQATLVSVFMLVLTVASQVAGESEVRGHWLGGKRLILQDLKPATEGYRVVGRWAFAQPRNVAIGKNILFVGSGSAILAYEAQGENPKLLSVVETPGLINTMVPAEERLYVANGKGGVRVMDYSHPRRPKDLGGVSRWATVNDVSAEKGLVILTAGSEGIWILNQKSLEPISHVELPGYARRVRIWEDTAFVTAGPATGASAEIDLFAIDISEPSRPRLERPKYDSSTGVSDFAIAGNLGYTAEGAAGLNVISLSGGRRFRKLASFLSPVTSIAYDGKELYCGADRSFMVLSPLRTPPQILGQVDAERQLGDVAAGGGLAAAVVGYHNVRLLSVRRATTPSRVADLRFPGNAEGVFARGNLVYVADGRDHFEVLDVSDRRNPKLVGEKSGPALAYNVWVEGNFAYVPIADGMAILDIQDPTSPRVVGHMVRVSSDGIFQGAMVRGKTVYVAAGLSGLLVADVKDPKAPRLISQADTQSWSHDVWVEGEVAYVADDEGLALVDVSNPSLPVIVGYVETPGNAFDVVARDGIAYVADKSAGLEIYDCRDPSKPVLLSKVEGMDSCEGVELKGNLLYAAAGYNGVWIVDVSEPRAPNVAGRVRTAGAAVNVSAGEDFIAVADYAGGVAIVQRTSTNRPQ